MSKRRNKRVVTRDTNIIELSQALVLNGRASEDGPRRRRWTRHDLATIRPMTCNQEDMFRAFIEGQNVCAHGTAGTGKTFCGVFLALNELLSQTEADRIIIVRSVVQTRDIGALPGTIEEKSAVYELPYVDAFTELLGKSTSYYDMKAAGLVEFHITSFLRGLTWDNAIVIVDEAQNMSFHEINTIMTRLGQNTRIIVLGDSPQTDLRDSHKTGNTSGLDLFLSVIKGMKEFSAVTFNRHDIVRGELVKSWIISCEDTGAMSSL